MDQAPPDQTNQPCHENGEGDRKISVILPYSLPKVVYVQSLPIWVYFAASVCILTRGVASLIAGGEVTEVLKLGGFRVLQSTALLLAGWWILWRWVVRGYKVAVIVLYVLYIPILLIVFFLTKADETQIRYEHGKQEES